MTTIVFFPFKKNASNIKTLAIESSHEGKEEKDNQDTSRVELQLASKQQDTIEKEADEGRLM